MRLVWGHPGGHWPSDVQQWPSGQTEAAELPKGRAKSELRNVAPAAGGRPQNQLNKSQKKMKIHLHR
ncbi:hypothetical protein SGRA_2948 [Saprospira grandis str. Lewin]|uniref:Uncharacterized protein n=1 Tax=Saprospira grandis (strain Lewin) TaxID=984262 RepID=H6LAT3_SAPGL|nr:hypothetical protein SGRA_2948 [Saprospira grandis str. Lewin]